MVNSEIWKGNLLSFHTITGANLRKMELLDLKAAHAATITCEKKNRAFREKYMQYLRKEMLSSLIDTRIYINAWLSAVRIPGKGNDTAHYILRILTENTEWRLFLLFL